MVEKSEIKDLLSRTEAYLTQTLLPFWIERSPDREYGGFLTYFDCNGKPTGETIKTFLMQIRMLYTMSSAHRAGYGGGQVRRAGQAGRGIHHGPLLGPRARGLALDRRPGGQRPPSWARSATASASACTPSASTSSPRATLAAANVPKTPIPPSAATWPTPATAGSLKSSNATGSPSGPGSTAATARAWTSTCT